MFIIHLQLSKYKLQIYRNSSAFHVKQDVWEILIEDLPSHIKFLITLYVWLKKSSALSKGATNKSESPNRNSTSSEGTFPGEISSLQSPDCAIVVKTQKAPGLYKNESTQRIQAFEGNQLALSGREDEEEDNGKEDGCSGGVAPLDTDPELISSKSHKTEEHL